MAKSLHLLLLLLLALVMACCSSGFGSAWASSSPKRKGPSRYTFYLHNTVYSVAKNNTDYFTSVYGQQPPGTFPNPFNFGVVSTFEAPLTLGASNSSAPAGTAQGFWVIDGRKSFVLFHVFTATIDDGQHRGSLTIMGQIVEAQEVRTLTVVGGTGDFLLARGVVRNRLLELVNGPPATWTLSFDLRLYY